MKVSMHNKQARRDRVKARFKILGYHAFCIDRDIVDDEQAQADYASYKDRKNEERIALGL